MGSVRLTYSDIKIPRGLFATPLVYDVDPLSATSYMPFGEQIPDLSFEKSAYAHGYTSHLKDHDVRPEKHKRANYSTLSREYDPLIGRWCSADPKRSL